MRLYKLAIVAQRLNVHLAAGHGNDISSDEVWRRIEDGSIFDFLSERLDMLVPLSLLTPIDRLELLLEWDNTRGCIEPFPFNVHRNGLCLLIGYLLEGISRRRRPPVTA